VLIFLVFGLNGFSALIRLQPRACRGPVQWVPCSSTALPARGLRPSGDRPPAVLLWLTAYRALGDQLFCPVIVNILASTFFLLDGSERPSLGHFVAVLWVLIFGRVRQALCRVVPSRLQARELRSAVWKKGV